MQHILSLKLIDEIARTGSIRAAAEKLAITPSALNRRLLKIEEELQVQLFERIANGVRLNAAGELFVSHIRRQMADLGRVQSQIEDLKGSRRGHIQIAFDDSLCADGTLAAAVAAYQTEHSGVSFGIDSLPVDRIAQRLTDYGADLGYALHPASDGRITSLAAVPAHITAVFKAGHPLADAETVRLETLVRYPLVLPRPGSLRMIISRAVQRKELAMHPLIEARLDFAAPLILKSDAIGFEVDIKVPAKSSGRGFARAALSGKDIANPHIHLLQLRGRALSVAAGRFAEGVRQRLAASEECQTVKTLKGHLHKTMSSGNALT